MMYPYAGTVWWTFSIVIRYPSIRKGLVVPTFLYRSTGCAGVGIREKSGQILSLKMFFFRSSRTSFPLATMIVFPVFRVTRLSSRNGIPLMWSKWAWVRRIHPRLCSSRMFRERAIVPASRRIFPSIRNAGQLCPGTSEPAAPNTLILNLDGPPSSYAARAGGSLRTQSPELLVEIPDPAGHLLHDPEGQGGILVDLPEEQPFVDGEDPDFAQGADGGGADPLFE